MRVKLLLIAGFLTGACGSALADSSIYVSSGAGGESFGPYDLGVSYFTPSGLSIEAGGPDNGTTSAFTPSSAAPGLTAIALTAEVAGFSSSASSSASADLSTGIVRGYASSTGFQGDANDISRLSDNIHFDVAGGGSKEVTVLAHLDGTATATGTFEALANVTYMMRFGGSFDFLGQTTAMGATASTSGYMNEAPPTGWDSYAFKNVTPDGFDFTGTFSVVDGDTKSFMEELDLECEEGAVCDFTHTGDFSLILPEGVSYTSDSGVFLTGGAVPEPATWTIMLIGSAGVGGVMRRRRAGSMLPGS